jgi:hypothetical protein
VPVFSYRQFYTTFISALTRKAIGLYLDNVSTDPDEAFGLWREREVDGVSYQENLRKEWD